MWLDKTNITKHINNTKRIDKKKEKEIKKEKGPKNGLKIKTYKETNKTEKKSFKWKQWIFDLYILLNKLFNINLLIIKTIWKDKTTKCCNYTSNEVTSLLYISAVLSDGINLHVVAYVIAIVCFLFFPYLFFFLWNFDVKKWKKKNGKIENDLSAEIYYYTAIKRE